MICTSFSKTFKDSRIWTKVAKSKDENLVNIDYGGDYDSDGVIEGGGDSGAIKGGGEDGDGDNG